MDQNAGAEKLKNLPIKESVHAQFIKAAADRGMKIQGLTERVIRAWLEQNVFFTGNIGSSNKPKRKRPKKEIIA